MRAGCRPDVSLESGQLAATTPVPTWKEIKPLTLNTDMNVLLEEKTRVVFTVKMAVPGSPDAEVGKAHVRERAAACSATGGVQSSCCA
jgi:hypothetical protein